MDTTATRHYLAPLFEPASVVIIGASERADSIGAVLMRNMLDTKFCGELYAVNPQHRFVQGVRCHATIGDLPAGIDLAIIATNAASTPDLVAQCGLANIKAAVVISAGFGETGATGAALEKAMLENARRYKVRLLGPNCLGIMRPSSGLNATFARGSARAGSLGLISQSGAVCTALLDWAIPNDVGFSSIVSLGASADVDFGELIDYLVNDPATAHILLYIEGVRDARRFVSALRAAARIKPVILMKVGRYAAGSRAIQSHTGAMVGGDDVFEAVVRRTGVVRVKTVGQLVAAAQALSSRIRPQGNRLAIITNGGGPGVMAADRATELGLPLASLASSTIDALQDALPPTWSHGNPLDLIGDADAKRRAGLCGRPRRRRHTGDLDATGNDRCDRHRARRGQGRTGFAQTADRLLDGRTIGGGGTQCIRRSAYTGAAHARTGGGYVCPRLIVLHEPADPAAYPCAA